MNALEKVRFLKDRKDQEGYGGPYFLDISTEENKWQPGEIEDLEKQYPWLPKFYIDFIQEFDSLGLAWVVFYGSRESEITPVYEEIEYWEDNAKGEYFPFGKDPSGSIYNFNKKGEVIFFSIDDYEWEKPIFIASNLEEFIDQCLLGSRYKEFNILEGDTFYDFLKDQGWT